MIVALFGTGLKLDRALRFAAWQGVGRLLLIVMPLTIAAVAVFGTQVMGLSLGAAIVLGAALAPTDPVLAGDVGVGPPGEEDEQRAELLDHGRGRAQRRARLPVRPARHHPGGPGRPDWLGDWVLPDVLYRCVVGVAIGARSATGSRPRPCACATATCSRPTSTDGSPSPPCSSSTAPTEAAGAYGFLAAFAGGVAFRRYEHGHEYNRSVHNGAEMVEKFGELALILLLGSSVTLAGLQAPGWTGLAARPRCCCAIRPASVAAALVGTRTPARRARVRRLVRRARDRLALLRGRRRRVRRPERERDHDDRVDDDRVRDRLDRRPRDDGERAQPPLVGNGPLEAPATFSVRGIGVGARG